MQNIFIVFKSHAQNAINFINANYSLSNKLFAFN